MSQSDAALNQLEGAVKDSSDEESAEPNELVPILPPEIEREIFEITAQFPRNAVQLVLVARRTQIWIERLIYETVTLSDPEICDKFLRTLESRPAQFFADNVKSLCVPGDIELFEAEKVLKACRGVVNLAVWLPPQHAPLFPSVCSLQPRRLSVNVSALCGSTSQPDFSHPFFAKVTHLELVDWMDWTTFLHIDQLSPHLTHLALDLDTETEGSVAHIRNILSSCRSLVICIGLVTNDEAMIVASEQLASIEDTRLVILSESNVIDNWEASLRDGTDASVWVFAESIVVAKTQLVVEILI
ncbi:hypothetical protein DFH07DRAFT_950185 [Mycena maculata]|uniref:Uncharacterized protein n=1 Tax=Mycena maculata TaxID=230809 RepID=A0AAD7K837_9AGAR|nr:hypothetical protein DFH07DRAFT_950185 [Mycena maculata]